jgi:hypothetical protein
MTDPDMNTLRQRLLEPLLKSADSSAARILAVELNADGQWASVDYTDQDRASWATSRHLNHLPALVTMALICAAWQKTS